MSTGRAGAFAPTPRVRRGESGQITLLVIAFALILGLAVAVSANASHVFVQRRALVSWADGAVTAAAQSVAHEHFYGGGRRTTLPVSEAAARQAVADYAARNGLAARFEDFGVAQVTVDVDSGRVTVELGASVRLLGVGEVTGGRASVRVAARATAVVPLE